MQVKEDAAIGIVLVGIWYCDRDMWLGWLHKLRRLYSCTQPCKSGKQFLSFVCYLFCSLISIAKQSFVEELG